MNSTWFHYLLLVLIGIVGGTVTMQLLRQVLGIKNDVLVSLITGVIIGPIAYLYFVKRVKK